MKKHLFVISIAALLAAGNAQAGPGLDIAADELGLIEADLIDMDMVRRTDGTLIIREKFRQSDGAQVTRMTVQKKPVEAAPVSGKVELTPGQRRLIWHTVAVPPGREAGDEIPQELAGLPRALAREHIEASPAPHVFRVGTRIAEPASLQPLPESVTLAVPSVENHLYTMVGDRVLVVEPATNTVVAEVAR